MKTLNDFLRMTDELRYADLFETLDKMGFTSNKAYMSLKEEFLLGSTNLAFHDRLRSFIYYSFKEEKNYNVYKELKTTNRLIKFWASLLYFFGFLFIFSVIFSFDFLSEIFAISLFVIEIVALIASYAFYNKFQVIGKKLYQELIKEIEWEFKQDKDVQLYQTVVQEYATNIPLLQKYANRVVPFSIAFIFIFLFVKLHIAYEELQIKTTEFGKREVELVEKKATLLNSIDPKMLDSLEIKDNITFIKRLNEELSFHEQRIELNQQWLNEKKEELFRRRFTNTPDRAEIRRLNEEIQRLNEKTNELYNLVALLKIKRGNLENALLGMRNDSLAQEKKYDSLRKVNNYVLDQIKEFEGDKNVLYEEYLSMANECVAMAESGNWLTRPNKKTRIEWYNRAIKYYDLYLNSKGEKSAKVREEKIEIEKKIKLLEK